MRFIKPFPPEREYRLFQYQDIPGQYTSSLCLSIENGNAHPCLRTDRYDDGGNCQTEYELLREHEFEDYVSKIFPEYVKSFKMNTFNQAELFVIKSEPWLMHDLVVIDCRSGRPYREIGWVWGSHCPSGGTIFIPVSFEEVRRLAPETLDFGNINADNWEAYVTKQNY